MWNDRTSIHSMPARRAASMPRSLSSHTTHRCGRAHVGIAAAFDTLVASEDTDRHKPEPEPFLEAARRLGARPQRCVVWEDSDLGIEAARRAGMEWIDVRSIHMPTRVSQP